MRKAILSLLFLGPLCLGLLAMQTSSQEVAAPGKPPAAVTAAELFRNVAKYAGQEVLVGDGEVIFASTHGALLRAGEDIFFELSPDMEANALAYLIANCSGPKGARAGCQSPMVGKVMPGLSATTGWPIISRARLVKAQVP